MYHVRSRNQHLPSVIRNSELIVKILGKSDNNPDHLDIGVGGDIGGEGKRDVARIFSGMGQCDEFDQHVIVGVFLFGGSASKKVTAALCRLSEASQQHKSLDVSSSTSDLA